MAERPPAVSRPSMASQRSHQSHQSQSQSQRAAPSRVKSHSSVASAAMSDYGYPNGHYGHLDEAQEEAFRKFKVYLQEKGDYRPGPPPSHDDPTLLRFLRARRWVVQDAYKQFKDTENWRAANHIDTLYETIDLKSYDDARRMYPQWTGRRDKRGIPCYLYEIKSFDTKTIAAYEKKANADAYIKSLSDGTPANPPKLLPLMALYENLTRFAQPLCTELQDREHNTTPVTLSTNIVDVGGCSMRQYWNLKGHMQAASQLATAHYPETLDRIYIVGAPFYFTTVWGWIKRWFDPITVSKIFVLSASEAKATMERFIDEQNIPKKYGGQLDFTYGSMPNLDPAIRKAVTWEEGYDTFPEGPMYWRPIDDGKRLECVGVGRVDGKNRWIRICTIPRAHPDAPILQLAPELIKKGGAAKADAATAEGEKKATEPVPTSTVAATAAAPSASEPKDTEAAPATTESEAKPEVTTGIETGTTAAVSGPPAEEKAPAPETNANGTAEPTVDAVQGVQNMSIIEDGVLAPKANGTVSEKTSVPDAPPPTTQKAAA